MEKDNQEQFHGSSERALESQQREVRALLVNRGFIADDHGNMSRIRKSGGATLVEFVDEYMGFTMIRRSYSARGILMLENRISSKNANTGDMIALFPQQNPVGWSNQPATPSRIDSYASKPVQRIPAPENR